MSKIRIAMHNTRLFPRDLGAAAYRLTGIASRCDWIIMTDSTVGDFYVHGDLSQPPRTVFLSMRGKYASIPYFYEEVLPKITGRFILITGSEDLTIPNQLDQRWRPFDPGEKEMIRRILEDDRLVRWFAENRDTVLSGMSTLPVGYVFDDQEDNSVVVETRPRVRVSARPLRVLCCHWTRTGPQWETRRRVSRLCTERFSRLVTVVDQEMSEPEYLALIEEHAFVICVQGGGIDPSPKAWTTIANGSIPVIVSSSLDDAYRQLPVAFVDEWDEDFLSEYKLREWMQCLSPYYEDPELRQEVLEKLQLDYWWNRIVDAWSAEA